MTLSYLLFLLEIFPYFLFAFILSCYIPGSILTKNLKVNTFQKIILSIGLGIVLWGWQGYLFGYLHIRWMSYVYLFAAFVLWIRSVKFTAFSLSKTSFFLGKHKIALLLIIVGMFIQLSSVWFVGVQSSKGAYSCCGDSADNYVELAITRSIVHAMPPMEAGITGKNLKNYHYWSDLINAELVRIFHLPLIPTEFQYTTIILSLLLGLSTIGIGMSLSMPKRFANWLLFFLYFGGDAIFLIVYTFTRYLTFSMSSLEDGSKFLSNYPRAFAVVLLFIALISFIEMIKQKKNWKLNLLTAVLIGSLVGFKVYIGIFAMTGYAIYVLFELIKKDYKILIYAAVAVLLSLLMYLPVNYGAGGLYFTGFWIFENFIVQPYFQAIRLEMARVIYQRDHKWLQVAYFEGIYILAYLVGIFGTKLIGLMQTKKSFKLLPKELHIFLLSGLLISAFFGFFFQQQSGGSNTFNFLVSIFIIGSIYTALSCSYFIPKFPKIMQYVAITIIILLTIPRVIVATNSNISMIMKGEGFLVPSEQMQFLSTISHILPVDSQLLVDHNKKFAFDYQSPYIYTLIGGNMYLSGIDDDLEAHNIPISVEKIAVANLVSSGNPCVVGETLLKIPARYIITDRDNYFYSTVSASFLDPLYQAKQYSLYKVNIKKITDFLHIKNVSSSNFCILNSNATQWEIRKI